MAPLKGVLRVRITNAGGRAEYWYAWRGGPRILHAAGPTDAVVDLKVAAAAAEAGRLYHEAHAARRAPPRGFLHALAAEWTASPEFAALAPRSRQDLRRHLAIVQQDLGELPVSALAAGRARRVLLQWRARYLDRPRLADHLAGALSRLIAWARDQGLTAADPMRDWPWVYRVDRSEILWTAAEIEAVCAEAAPDLQRAILMAAYSGLRQGDLIALTWSAVREDEIIRRTRKRGRVVRIPITAQLRAVLDACPRGEALTVLTREGRPWLASTLDKHWSRARAAAAATLPQVAAKRWHDLRGSYAVSLILAGVADGDVDRIMGWSPGRSEITRASYIPGSAVAEAAIARLRRFAARG